MIRRVIVFGVGASLAFACSLNPQPLPPGSATANDDASVDASAGSDATGVPNPDSGFVADAESDATREASPGDAASDVTSDADDGSTDGALDAQGD